AQPQSSQAANAIEITGRYLYGPPAADLALEADVVVRPTAKTKGRFAGYHFGRANRVVTAVRRRLEALPRTDAAGAARVQVALPQIPDTARPLEAQVLVRLREPNGRTVERSVRLPIDQRRARLGVRPAFKGNAVPENARVRFDAIMLGADGEPTAVRDVMWSLKRLRQHYQWYRQDGTWRFETVTMSRAVSAGKVTMTKAQPAAIEAPVTWGRYRLDVTKRLADGRVLLTSYLFKAGYWQSEAADSPETLDVAFDRKSYKPGDVATLKIEAKQAGRALIAVLGDGVLQTREVDIAKGGGAVRLQVDASWQPGVYVAAMLYRPLDRRARRMPGRSIGIAWLGLSDEGRRLNVEIEAPDKVAASRAVEIPVRINGAKPGETAYVTLAAVDAGILNLTRYAPPSPHTWFNGQRRLGVELRDYYGRLIDGMRAVRGHLRSGGDGDGDLSMRGSPTTTKPVALFSGIVKVDETGLARVTLDLPDFNGTVRLMAVSWSAGKIGAASRDMIVRDKVALLAAGPRFMTYGDRARLDLDIHNIEGPAAPYTLTLTKRQGDAAPEVVTKRTLTLGLKERRIERVTLKADRVGTVDYGVQVTGPDGLLVERGLRMEVHPPAGDVRRSVVSLLQPETGVLTLSGDLFANLMPERSRVSVAVGAGATFDVPGLLTQLDRYPHGCAEQTVSRALPLLYANAVATRLGIAEDGGIKARVEKAIARVFQMQDSAGAFGVWGPYHSDLWLTAYVTDFLTRARETGYLVPRRPMAQALDRLRNHVAFVQDFKKGGEPLAYALYVLARNGKAPIGDLRYFADTRLSRFTTPLAKAHLGAALAMMGDKPRAQTAFAAALAGLRGTDEATPLSVTRADFGSRLRDGAAVLTLLSETGVAPGDEPGLVQTVSQAIKATPSTSTQEQAWLIMAARAMAKAVQTRTALT
ncbi:MAG: alpha-2-macroglobulin family protein, partial [Pseudomonadota bacterium]